MKLTKFEHACFIVEENGERMVVDPGVLSTLPEDLSNVTVIFISHMHDDHFGQENIQKIVEQNSEVTILAHPEVLEKMINISCKKVAIDTDIGIAVGNFQLDVFCGDHAVIYEKSPCHNLRIIINNKLYFPGDSLNPVDQHISAVAFPLSAPWSKVAEIIDFIKSSKADLFFPVHDATLSEIGKMYQTGSIKTQSGIGAEQYKDVSVGATITI